MHAVIDRGRRDALRALLRLAGAVAVTHSRGLVGPLSTPTPSTSRPGVWDVVIVGGGLAGLAAAETVALAGHSVLVLEAQDRLAGRIDTTAPIPLPGHVPLVVERGAQLFHADMTLLRRLMRRSGVGEVLLPVDHTAVRLDGDQRTLVAPAYGLDDLDESRIARHLEARDRSLRDLLDILTHEMSRRGSALDSAQLASALTELLGLPLERVSARGALGILATQPAWREDDRQADRGLDSLVHALCRPLPVAPRLGAPVRAIRRHASGLSVHVDGWPGSGVEVVARRVIVAVPPTVARNIHIEGLPSTAREALESWEAGAMVKTTLLFARPFWRDSAQASGTVVALDTPGVTVRDVSLPGETIGRIVVFAGGPAGRRMATLEDRTLRRELLALMARGFAHEPPKPLAVVTGRWVDHPWSGGGYNSWVRAGRDASSPSVLRSEQTPVRFAGSELSTRYAGFMEGALHSGRETAQQVLRSLRQSP